MTESIFKNLNLIADNVWLYGGAFALVLGILVFVHEWGHYITARLCGVRVESFSIGFGKELFGITDKKGTRWKFSLIPLGGYVKMFGDVDPASARHEETIKDEDSDEIRLLTEEEKKVAFYSQSVWRRAIIVFAGPAINFIFAVFILAGLYGFYGQPVSPPMAAAVVSGTAAESAGFEPHDKVLAIDGKAIDSFEDIRREVMVGLDQEQVFTVERNGEVVELVARPEKREEEDRFGFKHSRGMLGLIQPGSAINVSRIASIDGIAVTDTDQARALLVDRMDRMFKIALKTTRHEVSEEGADEESAEDNLNNVLLIRPLSSQNESLISMGKDSDLAGGTEAGPLLLIVHSITEETFTRLGPLQSFNAAIRETSDITTSTLEALFQMITGIRSATELGGIIRIGAIAGDMARSGFIALITFTALLSINLGLINLFPIPMLDGGHLVFYAVEVVKGAPISEQVQEYAFRFGLAILVGIMLFANLNDIVQLIL